MLTVTALRVLNLEPVSFTLDAGECIALEGPSGSGKSLLLRAIADLDPAEGTVGLDGADRMSMTGPEWRRKVRYLATESGWWSERVRDHFGSGEAADELLIRLGLSRGALEWSLERASTGERQRLALARGLLDRPYVLLLDEPTSALDDRTARSVEALITERASAQGAAAIVVTHDEEQAKRLATRRLVIEDGRVVERGL